MAHPRRLTGDHPKRQTGVASSGVSLPALPGERHVCGECAFSYVETDADRALITVESVVEDLVSLAPVMRARSAVRLSRDTWSVIEYLCHLRDVLMTSTLRLHRIAVEYLPTLEPMYNDVRALRFRYRDADVIATLEDLGRAYVGLADEVAATEVDTWRRLVRRWPGEERTGLWIVRHAAHEAHHHAQDIRKRLELP